MAQITESLLEMNYFRELLNLFTNHYGANFIQIMKPSPQAEAWLGFDEGFAFTNTISGEDLENELRNAIKNNKKNLTDIYVGYYLQFKVVDKMLKESKYKPQGFNKPYYRSELSLEPKKTSKISQHETLYRLKDIRNSFVYYACPMVFTKSDILKPPDLDDIQFVDINSAPSGYLTNTKHFITFQDIQGSQMLWNSIPTEGRTIGIEKWINLITASFPEYDSANNVLSLIKDSGEILVRENIENRILNSDFIEPEKQQLLPESLYILHLKKQEENLD